MKISLYIFTILLCGFMIFSGASPQKPTSNNPHTQKLSVQKKRSISHAGLRYGHQASISKRNIRTLIRR